MSISSNDIALGLAALAAFAAAEAAFAAPTAPAATPPAVTNAAGKPWVVDAKTSTLGFSGVQTGKAFKGPLQKF